jgi:dihydrofolate reductase/dihydrofolate reductase (trimethoprim resistance protein)
MRRVSFNGYLGDKLAIGYRLSAIGYRDILPKQPWWDVGRRSVVDDQVTPISTGIEMRPLQDLIEIIANDSREEIFIAGGEKIHRLFMPYADTLYLTEVDLEPAGDTTFPDLPADFHCTERVDVSGPTR